MILYVPKKIGLSTPQLEERRRNCKSGSIQTRRMILMFRSRFSAPEVVGPTDPDPMVMAPLVVGDFILYTGQQIGSTFEVNGLTANG